MAPFATEAERFERRRPVSTTPSFGSAARSMTSRYCPSPLLLCETLAANDVHIACQVSAPGRWRPRCRTRVSGWAALKRRSRTCGNYLSRASANSGTTRRQAFPQRVRAKAD